VDISGGEPLLLRDLTALAQRVTGGGRTVVSVTTNGWHLTRRAEELTRAVDAIRVSLDGPDETSHDRIRGAGSFAHAQDGIRATIAAGIPLQIHTVLMTGNHASAQQMVDLADSLGAGGITFLQMLPIGAGLRLPYEMLTDPAAIHLLARLRVPEGLRIRLRTRVAAGGFTIVRADGRVWRNDEGSLHIDSLRPLTSVADLARAARDGSA